jgi:8-oxo-dGTP pyrophosphatase MutT (NUDIX family)
MQTKTRTSAIIKVHNSIVFELKLDGRLVLPGGKCYSGDELPVACLSRELQEEINIDVKESRFIKEIEFEMRLVHYFLVQKWEGNIKAREVPIILIPINYLSSFIGRYYPFFIYNMILEVI